MINNGTPRLKSPKEPKQKSRIGTASNKTNGGGGGLQLVCGRPTRALRTESLYELKSLHDS